MASVGQRATVGDLYRTEGNSELIGGKIVAAVPGWRMPVNEVFA